MPARQRHPLRIDCRVRPDFRRALQPAVTLTIRLRGELRTHEALAYIGVQILAAVVGVVLAHAMFGLPLIQPGTHVRTGHAQWLSEAVAAFGLVLTILLGMRHRSAAVPALVASYILPPTGSLRVLVRQSGGDDRKILDADFAGIRPGDIFGFVLRNLEARLSPCSWIHDSSPERVGPRPPPGFGVSFHQRDDPTQPRG